MNKTFRELLKEMEKINNSELSRSARLYPINVFVFPKNKSKDGLKGEFDVDINGKTPGCDMRTFDEVYTLLIHYYGGDEQRVKAILDTPYTDKKTDLNMCSMYRTIYGIPGTNETEEFRFRFWTYRD